MVICLTGPIAAGKNAASNVLEKNGFACIDADKVSHEVMERAEMQQKIIASFSNAAAEAGITLTENGKINRHALAALLFKNTELLRLQESILYPAISSAISAFIDDMQKAGKNVCINATLLYKTPELMQKCSAILYIDCPKALRFFRIKKRNPSWKTDEIFERFSAQSNLFTQYSVQNADIYRVWNVGLLSSLEKKITRFCKDFV